MNMELDVADVDPTPCFMLGHREDEEADLQAVSRPSFQEAQRQIRRHLRDLSVFGEEDMVAALDDASMVDASVMGEVAGGSSDSSSSDDEEEGEIPPPRPVEDGRRWRSYGVQTGGVRDSGRLVGLLGPPRRKAAEEPSVGDQIRRMKVVVPLMKGLSLHQNLKRLICNYAVDDSFKRGEELHVVKGTKVKEVSRDQLLDQRKVLAAGPAGTDDGVDRKLRHLDRAYRR